MTTIIREVPRHVLVEKIIEEPRQIIIDKPKYIDRIIEKEDAPENPIEVKEEY